MASTSVSADYHTTFQADKRSILSLFEADAPSATDITARLQTLRSGLNDNLAFLPAYDRRSYDLQLKELEAKLSQLRAKDKPKSRFAFSAAKPKAPKPELASSTPPSSAPPSAVSTPPGSSAPASPIHLVSDQHDQVIRAPSDVKDGYTISLTSISSSVIDLRPHSSLEGSAELPTSLHAKHLKRCVLLVPVMEGSAIMEGLEDCLVILGAQQSRIHSSSRTTILLHVPSTPIIEHSSSLIFGPYPAFLDPPVYTSKHAQVQDFDWVREGSSPNWTLLEEGTNAKVFSEEDAAAIGTLSSGSSGELEAVLERLLQKEVNLQPNAS